MKANRGIDFFLPALTVFLVATVATNAEISELSAYYGFEEIEIIKLDWGTSGLQTTDLNGDGLNDILVVNNKRAKIELLLQKASPGPVAGDAGTDPNEADVNALPPQQRFANESIAVSQQIHSMATGDLNSDGLPDIAFYGEPEGLYVILQKSAESNSGSALRLQWHTRRKIAVEDGLHFPKALACADLNGDGKEDMALAGQDSVYVVVQETDGTLAEPVKYPVSGQILAVEPADLNGDGLTDLVLIANDPDKPVHVRFGLEGGYLGPQIQYFIERPFAFRLHNMDDDKGEEALTIDARSGRLLCYSLGTAAGVDQDWPVLLYPLPSGEGSTNRDLVTGDFDGDGLGDIVISEPGSAELVLYRHRSEVGLAEPVRFPAFSEITSLSAGDIDGDGKTDVAVLSVKEKAIGLSRFENKRLTFPKPLVLSEEPLAMELADMDNSGSADCVHVAKDANDVRLFGITYDLGRAQTERTWSMAVPEMKANPDGMRVFDADQDGLLDVLIFVRYELPMLLRQVEKGDFAVVDSVEAQNSLIKEATEQSIAVADVDSEPGRELLVAQKNFARSLVFADGRRWSVIDQYNARSTENQVSAVAAVSISGQTADERPAILLLDGQRGTLQILKADDGTAYGFVEETDVGTWNTSSNLKILSAPIGPDRSRSIILFDGNKFALVLPPDREGQIEHFERLWSYETDIEDGGYGNLAAGDINGDGQTDIVMVDYKKNHIEILTLDASDQPVPAMRFKIFEAKSYRDDQKRTKAAVEPREMQISDVTGDGKDDLITLIHDRVIIYPQD